MASKHATTEPPGHRFLAVLFLIRATLRCVKTVFFSTNFYTSGMPQLPSRTQRSEDQTKSF